MGKHIFVKASEELLKNYIEPNKHELNCVSCTLKLLQFVSEKQGDEISEQARGTDSGIIGGAEGILKVLHKDESIHFTKNFQLNPYDQEPEIKSIQLNIQLFKKAKFNEKDFSVNRKLKKEYTDKSKRGYILNIKIGDKNIPIYDDKNDLIQKNINFLDDFKNKESKLTIIGEDSFHNRKQFINKLKGIPNGCLSISSLEAYMKVGIVTVPLNVFHCVIVGKSKNGNPYLIDGQSKNKVQGIYRGLNEIYKYFNSGNFIFFRYLTNDSKKCGTIKVYQSTKSGSNPFDNQSLLKKTMSLTKISSSSKKTKKKNKN